MTTNVLSLPAFLKRPQRKTDVIDVTPTISPDHDLEVLDQIIKDARSAKVIADCTLMRAEQAALEAARYLNECVDRMEKELRERGTLCRK